MCERRIRLLFVGLYMQGKGPVDYDWYGGKYQWMNAAVIIRR